LKVLVTGGAGFIGRWVVKKLLEDNHQVWVLDNLSNGKYDNIKAFIDDAYPLYFIENDIKNEQILDGLFKNRFDICYHLAASINVQDSIDEPKTTFANDTVGAYNVLEKCRMYHVKMVLMSTCMVYDKASVSADIAEEHPVKPASPYAGSKLAAEHMVLSYYHAYGLPISILRPFNTYGPFQKSSGEGGVVAIFIKNKLENEMLNIYGDGKQTRDLLYVEDCAEFVVEAGYSDKANGQIINAGLGRDISINELAELIIKDTGKIKHIQHIHPQSEIQKLLCNYSKAKRVLNWEPKISLDEGIKRTEYWILEEMFNHKYES